MSILLLDTHIWLWYTEGERERLSEALVDAIEQARMARRVEVSAISVWEIGMLCGKGKINLSTPLNEWIQRAMVVPGFRLRPLDAETARESTLLPGDVHGDPADRFLIAAARVHGLTLVTADGKIRDYGQAGHVQVLPA